MIEEYFYDNFQYSLAVNFRADNKGILGMIREKKPAYCSYFATALVLLLRAQEIPARVVTGFLVDEKVDKEKNKLLARVKDGHAWVEVLKPTGQLANGNMLYAWHIYDGTPSRTIGIGPTPGLRYHWDAFREKVFLSLLRFRAQIENLDQRKVKKAFLAMLLCLLLFMHRKSILTQLRSLWRSSKKRLLTKRDKPDALSLLYRQYLDLVHKRYTLSIHPNETDTDFIKRIQADTKTSSASIANIRGFVYQYHLARFGNKAPEGLDVAWKALQEDLH